MALAWLAACDATPDATDSVDWPPNKPYQTLGDDGSIVAVALDFPEGPRLQTFAAFSSDLQGYITGAACVAEELPCISEMPEFLDGQVRANNRRYLPGGDSVSRWVGDQVSIGPLFAELQHATDERLLFYEAEADQGAIGNLPFRFGGEWSDYAGQTPTFGAPFTVVAPMLNPGDRLDLSEPIEFRWLSSFDNDVWLWVQGPDTRQFFQLEDDGLFVLNPFDLGLEPAEVVEVGIGIANRDAVDVDGNWLEMLTLNGAGFKGSECGPWLDVPVENTPPAGEMVHPLFYGYQFEGILDDGLHDFIDPETGLRASAKVTFTFFDDTLTELCTIEYDADNAGRAAPLITTNDVAQYDSYRVALFNGRSTCGLVDPNITGFQDLRNWLEQFQWGFALGEVDELEELFIEQIGIDGWNQQKDAIYSVYWTRDGLFGEEQGYGYHTRLSQCDRPGLNIDFLPEDRELIEGYYYSFPFWIVPILQ